MKDVKIQNILSEVEAILKKYKRLLDKEGKIIKNTLIELVIKLDAGLIGLLSKNKTTKQVFFVQVDGVLVFDKQKFLDFVNMSEFLPKSYTAFENQIGLASNKSLLSNSSEVVLAFPYKDCVLEGGQEKTNEKRDEVFFNTTLAPDEIDRLRAPKALVNWKKYDEKGEYELKQWDKSDNLIIRGNNLFALCSLLPKYRGKVKLIYIDPPYNTGSDDFRYNDKFNHSTWLVFMKNRLEIARELLKPEGSLFVQVDDNEQAYLKVLLDSVFDRNNYLNTITVKSKASSGASGGGEDKRIKKNTEFILVYQKSTSFSGFNDVFIEEPLNRYIQSREDNGKNFAYKSVLVGYGNKKYFKTIKSGRGNDIKLYRLEKLEVKSVSKIGKEENITSYEVYKKYFDKVFTLENAQTSIRDRVLDATGENDDGYYIAEYVPVSGKHKSKLTEVIFAGKTKRLLSWLKGVAYINEDGELIKRDKVGTLWDDLSWSSVSGEGDVELENGKKPEGLLGRIIKMGSEKDDLILDYHLGSGTTCAVAQKMGRKWIGVEQLDYGDEDCVVRLKNVIKGDKTGISEELEWEGGGSFVYAELLELNAKFVEELEKAKTSKTVLNIYEKMKKEAFFRYEIDLSKFDKKALTELPLEDQKKVLLDCLDANHFYVNYSDIDDATFKVAPKEKKLNKEFYE